MIVIIDGYNLLKQIFPGVKENLDKQKKIFIQELAFYKSKKQEVKEIVVVFDGGLLLHATREIHQGIVVVYSGIRNCADNWIINFVARNRPKQILVVTLDRKLKASCEKMGADNISVYDFYQIMQKNILNDAQESLNHQGTDFKKLNHLDFDDLKKDVDNKALDLLMKQASIRIPEEKAECNNNHRRKGKSYTPSKKEKMIYKKLKKII